MHWGARQRQVVAAHCCEHRKCYSLTLRRLILCHVNITSIKNIATINLKIFKYEVDKGHR